MSNKNNNQNQEALKALAPVLGNPQTWEPLNNLLKAVEDDYLELPDLLREYVAKLDVLDTGGRKGVGPLGDEVKEPLTVEEDAKENAKEMLTGLIMESTGASTVDVNAVLAEIKEFGKLSEAMASDMLALVEINSGKSIDQSIEEGTLAADVEAAHKRFKADVAEKALQPAVDDSGKLDATLDEVKTLEAKDDEAEPTS